jgi:hypothetical protein
MIRRPITNNEIIERAPAIWVASLTPMMRFWMGSFIAVCLVVMSFGAQADIRIQRDNFERYSTTLTISITGTITNRDADEFQRISKELEYAKGPFYNFLLALDSEGGDVSAAISIGRLVRKYDGITVISENSNCYSSCALIFIAGVERRIHPCGELGLHRPYLSSTPQSRDTIETEVPIMLSQVRSYIVEMGITDNFYQQMVNTEPSQMVIYNCNDYTGLVPLSDPTYAEIENAYEARMHGVTTSEMRHRTHDAKPCMPDTLPANAFDTPRPLYMTLLDDCYGARLWGLSEPVYHERDARSKKECWFNDADKFSEADRATIAKTPSKLVSDLPLTIRWETCVRNIMLGRTTPEQTSWSRWLFGH